MPRISKGERRVHSVSWKPEQWRRLMAAAKVLAERDGGPVRVSDVIRGPALQRADELLGNGKNG